MKISLTSTDDFAEMGNVMGRVWTGQTEAGGECKALIAALQLDENEGRDLKLIPPPVPEWSPALREAMNEIWLRAGNLSDAEAMAAVCFVRARAAFRDKNWIEQNCERCGEAYRGPSMYCSHGCATLDAT